VARGGSRGGNRPSRPAMARSQGSRQVPITNARHNHPEDKAPISRGGAYDASESPDAVRIITMPVSYAGAEGTTATFTVVAVSGNGSPIAYQWQERIGGTWTNMANGGRTSGVLTQTLTITSLILDDDGRVFRCRLTNSYNTVYTTTPSILITSAVWNVIDESDNTMVTETVADDIVTEDSA